MVSQDRWHLVIGSVALKHGTFCKEHVVLQDKWSLMAVVSQRQLSLYSASQCCIFHTFLIPQMAAQYFVFGHGSYLFSSIPEVG